MANCRESKLELLPPDINRSQWYYVPEGQAIRLGLGVIKNVGQSAVESIILVRNRLGGFNSI
jgi:DNA polymerase-3 subunit alpha